MGPIVKCRHAVHAIRRNTNVLRGDLDAMFAHTLAAAGGPLSYRRDYLPSASFV